MTTATDFLKHTNNAAHHFGFRTVEHLQKHPAVKECAKKLPHTITATNKHLDEQLGLLTTGLTEYCNEKLHASEEPILLYRTLATPRTGEVAVSFHVFGVSHSIAEAILIQTSRSLLSDLGYKDHVVRVNSLGCSESVTRYSRELTNYLRKRIDHLTSDAREQFKEHPLFALRSLLKDNHELGHRSPSTLEYLSDSSRKHFRDLVEFLDISETPYEIDPHLLGHHECYSDALFSIDVQTEADTPSPITVRGGRFDEFVTRNTDEETPVAGVVITMKESKAPARIPRHKPVTPSVYVIHLGFGPRVRTLLLLEELRQAGVPVWHDMTNNSLSAQLRHAESLDAKYVVIIGQKEFVEGTALLRDMTVRTQEAVPQDTLVRRLKRRKDVVTV